MLGPVSVPVVTVNLRKVFDEAYHVYQHADILLGHSLEIQTITEPKRFHAGKQKGSDLSPDKQDKSRRPD